MVHMPITMIHFIICTLFLSSVAGVESEGGKLDLSVLLRRISDLEERLNVQERLNEEQDTVIKALLLERGKEAGTHEIKVVMSVKTEQNEGGQWQNGDLENRTISDDRTRRLNTGIISQTSPTVQNAVKDSKNISPESKTKKIQRAIAAGDTAFYSYLSHSESDPGHHQTIIFDRVVTNAGGNYNHHSGIFNSPQNGVYTFSWTVYCYTGGHFTTQLVVNSNAVGSAFCNAQGADNIRHTTGVVVVGISLGDIVYVRTHPTNSIVGLLFSNIDARTSFSGWNLF